MNDRTREAMTIAGDNANRFSPGVLATYGLVAAFALLHVVLAEAVPLAHYETHYALYARHLDLSYVDHPPLTGWLQWLAISISDSDGALRVIPVLLLTVSQLLLLHLTRELFREESPWLGFVSVLIAQGMVVTHLAITMNPEVPLMFLSLLAAWITWRLLHADTWGNWLALGLVLGLAGLAKYTAVLLAVSALIALSVLGRKTWILGAKPWAAAALALFLISPVLVWNWQNDWLSFAYQLGYQLDTGSGGPEWSVADALEFQVEQFGLYSPLVYLGGIAAIVWSVRNANRAAALLLIYALPFLLVLSLFAFVGRAKFHWTYVGWLLLTPLLARWLLALWSRLRVRILAYASAIYSTALLAGFALVLFLPSLRLPFVHPLAQLVGWRDVAVRAAALREEIDSSEAENPPILMVRNWHHAGLIAWYAPTSPVYEYENELSQYTAWYGELPEQPRGILIVSGKVDPPPKNPHPRLDCERVESLPVHYGANLVNTFYLYRCEPQPS